MGIFNTFFLKSRLLIVLVGVLFSQTLKAQVGIGTPMPNASAQLDLVSNNRGLLIPRIELLNSTDTTTITNGNVTSLLIYNTHTNSDVIPGFYYWNGIKWVRLAVNDDLSSSGETLTTLVDNNDGTLSYFDEDNTETIINIAEIYTTGTTNPNILGDEKTGDTYFNSADNTWWYFNGTDWAAQSGISPDIGNALTTDTNGLAYVTANNGLTATSGHIQLGGTLNTPTQITTDATNTLAITGLQTGDVNTEQIVMANPTTGVLTQTSASSLMQELEVVHTAANGQTQFSTPAPITDIQKVNVYRNGVKISLTPIDANTIQLETGVVCYANDEIRIVQFK